MAKELEGEGWKTVQELYKAKAERDHYKKALEVIVEELTSKHSAGLFCDLCNLTAKLAEQALKAASE